MTESKENTWLPNLVGGVSIWKLAVDLNEPKFFDGRLLVPETEGSESLPVTVRWDLTGLTPLLNYRQWIVDTAAKLGAPLAHDSGTPIPIPRQRDRE